MKKQRLIDASQFDGVIVHTNAEDIYGMTKFAEGFEAALEMIRNAPTVEVDAPPHKLTQEDIRKLDTNDVVYTDMFPAIVSYRDGNTIGLRTLYGERDWLISKCPPLWDKKPD